jgi:hypothetical protein
MPRSRFGLVLKLFLEFLRRVAPTSRDAASVCRGRKSRAFPVRSGSCRCGDRFFRGSPSHPASRSTTASCLATQKATASGLAAAQKTTAFGSDSSSAREPHLLSQARRHSLLPLTRIPGDSGVWKWKIQRANPSGERGQDQGDFAGDSGAGVQRPRLNNRPQWTRHSWTPAAHFF